MNKIEILSRCRQKILNKIEEVFIDKQNMENVDCLLLLR